MKTKIICLILIFSGIITSNFAGKIELDDAKRVALNFYYERINQYQNINYKNILITDIKIEKIRETSVYYFFGINNTGFVIVTAYDGVIPVLGYSFTGYSSKEFQPPQYQELLNIFKHQIKYMIENDFEANKKVQAAWKHLLTNNIEQLKIFMNEKEVEPLLTTTWNQGIYYNEMCPADPLGPGGHCYAGCVPTAMGQVVNYFRFPIQGTGSYSYQCPPYGTLSADFGNTTYQWNSMAISLSNSNLAVAGLLYHLGVSVDLVYGPNGSGMYNHKAAYSLRTYFKYSPETQYVYRDSTSMDWDSLLISHLDKKIPMYYAGWSVPNINGHAFVCDGYQDTNYYHFNWGWGGSYDGYFYTDNLSPGGSNFNLAQELIINCYPDTINFQYPYYCTGDSTLTSHVGTIEDGSGPIDNYLNNTDCSWLIAPLDSVENIYLNFIKFDTDTNDFVTVYDGETTSDTVLGVFSGSTLPESVTSSGDKMLITFISDDDITSAGWLASYSSEIPVYCSGLTSLTAISDTFSDGSGPRNYHNLTTCMWNIKPPDASEITIYFTEFNTEEEFDPVKIFDGTTLIAELSGTEIPDPITAYSGSMFLTFTTNTTVTAPGWEAYYEINNVSIIENDIFENFAIFPNPASDELFLEFTLNQNQSCEIKIITISSITVFSERLNNFTGNYQNVFNTKNFSDGVYILNIRCEKGVINKKIIINH